jgi:hypothetical protein
VARAGGGWDSELAMTAARVVLFAAIAFLSASGPAWADGSVLRAKGCGDRIFVTTEHGYSVLRASDPGSVEDDDGFSGDADRIGFSSFYVARSGRRFFAEVEERGLTKSEVTQRIAASCRSPTERAQTFGQVERATGCGGKIFVNTAAGYAIVERLAGGEIAVGDALTGDFSRVGRATLKDRQSNAEIIVFIDEFGLEKSAAARKEAQSCH